MGYTHYWKLLKDIDSTIWSNIVLDIKKVIKESGIKISGWNGKGKPKFNDTVISFNGNGDKDSHETFSIENKPVNFSFCKTARKPYDTVVVACLVVLKNYLKNDIEITSDGDLEELQPGIDLCMNVLGYACNPLIDETDETDEVKPFDQMNFEDLHKLLNEIHDNIDIHTDNNGEEYGEIDIETFKKIKKCLRRNY